MILLLAACAAVPSDTVGEADPCAAPPALHIGTGADAFEPLAPADPIVMVHGPQGGWHLFVSARVERMASEVTIDARVEHLATETQVANGVWRVALLPEGDCGGTFPGLYAFLDVSDLAQGELDTPPELLAGETLRVHMRVTDDEREVSATLDVTATPDPDDVPGEG